MQFCTGGLTVLHFETITLVNFEKSNIFGSLLEVKKKVFD